MTVRRRGVGNPATIATFVWVESVWNSVNDALVVLFGLRKAPFVRASPSVAICFKLGFVLCNAIGIMWMRTVLKSMAHGTTVETTGVIGSFALGVPLELEWLTRGFRITEEG